MTDGKYRTLPDLSKFTNLKEINIYGEEITRDCSTISKLESLTQLSLNSVNLSENMIDFRKLTNLQNLELKGNYLNTSDIEKLKALKNNKNLIINLSNNSITDASALLELDSSCKINLSNNLNLKQESKDALKQKFGNNVWF